MLNFHEVICEFEKNADAEAVRGMTRFGIHAHKMYGLSIPLLRKMARGIGKDHELARLLWDHDSRESRILASMIEDLNLVTEEQLERWVRNFDSWEVCDQCCMNLIEKSIFAWQKAFEWSASPEEFVKRAGFVLMARLAVSDRLAADSRFEACFPSIVRESTDNRTYVKKAVNWALRQIGKRNSNLNSQAIHIALDLKSSDSKSARWVGSDALRELQSEMVQERLRAHSSSC
ncbi:MAG: DNA alkylation repair protein [Candidatus Latescibacterota bacterium]